MKIKRMFKKISDSNFVYPLAAQYNDTSIHNHYETITQKVIVSFLFKRIKKAVHTYSVGIFGVCIGNP
ncbi:hypothetical protein [Cytobacillus luteolus]|uniref:hypothetical protein n=1 Tax=Litchfieldia luteola TaxID=682179 RepID=UPI00187481EB|nr:hypothetical protein [Cytobacillus luteolus]